MKTRNLTFDEAVEEHRKMWRWITENVKKGEHVTDIKARYFVENLDKNQMVPTNGCFCCQYARENTNAEKEDHQCSHCPIIWNVHKYRCITFGPYSRFLESKRGVTHKKMKELAREIANLPINEKERKRSHGNDNYRD